MEWPAIRRLYFWRRLINRFVFLMDDNPFDLTLAKDKRWLLRRFTDILKNSRDHVYVCQTKARPILYQTEFRDALIRRAASRSEFPVDLKVLVHREHHEALGYWDSSFRVTDVRVGDFIVGDAGGIMMVSRDGIRFKVRDIRADSASRRAFLSEYELAAAIPLPSERGGARILAGRRLQSSGRPLS